MTRSSLLLALVAAVVVSLAASRPACAEAALGAREWVGLELSPLALNAGSITTPEGSMRSSPLEMPAPYALVPGLTLRILRQQGPRWYWTPVQASAVFGGSLSGGHSIGAPTMLLALQTEVGAVIGLGGSSALELGLAGGLGGLGIVVEENTCDNACIVGGRGAMLSPVARFSRRDLRASRLHSVGVFARAAIPLQGGAFGGYNTGFGLIVLLGVDLGFGPRG